MYEGTASQFAKHPTNNALKNKFIDDYSSINIIRLFPANFNFERKKITLKIFLNFYHTETHS